MPAKNTNLLPPFKTVQEWFRQLDSEEGHSDTAIEKFRKKIGAEAFDSLNQWEPDSEVFKNAYDALNRGEQPPQIELVGYNRETDEAITQVVPWSFEAITDLEEDAEPLKWIIEDLLLADTGTLVSGHPHSGKSLSWLAAAIDSVCTQKVWGQFKATAERVLYVETEDPRAVVVDRIKSLVKGLPPGTLAEGFFWTVTGPFDILARQKDLFDLVERAKPDWLVLSTLQGLLNGRDWKSQSDMGEVNSVLVRLSRKCPIVVLTHSPWDKEAKRAAGSVTQAANFATTLHFEKTGSIIKVSVDSKLRESDRPFKLNFETEDVVTADGNVKGEVRRISYEDSTLKERIAKYLKTNPDASSADVAAEFKCSERYVREIRS